MKKIKYLLPLFLIFSSNIVGQNANTDASANRDEIELQDLSTVIKSDSLVADAQSLPPFSVILDDVKSTGSIEPVLPDVAVQENTSVADAYANSKEKSVFAEGQVGGGYPCLFFGDFSVYRLSGQNPFRIDFDHNSAAGYSGNSLNDGYKDSSTKIAFEKTLQGKKIKFVFDGEYKALVNGLQNKVAGISDITQNDVCGGVDFSWNVNKILCLGISLDSGFYNRYSTITEAKPEYDNLKKLTVFDLSPVVYGNVCVNNFDIDFSGSYMLYADGDYANNRGLIKAGLCWNNESVKLYGDVSAAFGTRMNDNSAIVPFTLGTSALIPVNFSNRRAAVTAEGGLASSMQKIPDLETKYKFTSVYGIPNEKSDWFGTLMLALPVGTSFTASADFDFRTTAFNNKTTAPDYSVIYCGYYGLIDKKQTLFTTDFELTYYYKFASLAAGVKSNWIDIPVLENNHLLSCSVGLLQQKSKYGLNISSNFGLDDDNDPIVPFFNFDAFVKVTNAVQFGFNIEDFVYLVSGKSRTYAGEYITRSGTASLMAKFFF